MWRLHLKLLIQSKHTSSFHIQKLTSTSQTSGACMNEKGQATPAAGVACVWFRGLGLCAKDACYIGWAMPPTTMGNRSNATSQPPTASWRSKATSTVTMRDLGLVMGRGLRQVMGREL